MVALYCLTFVAFIPLLLALGSIPFRIQQFSLPDVQKPREQANSLTGAGARIIHAQNNGWEATILFTATLFIAYQAGVDAEQLALPSVLFAFIRIVYSAVYVLGFGYLRFASFLASAAMLIWMLCLAFI